MFVDLKQILIDMDAHFRNSRLPLMAMRAAPVQVQPYTTYSLIFFVSLAFSPAHTHILSTYLLLPLAVSLSPSPNSLSLTHTQISLTHI